MTIKKMRLPGGVELSPENIEGGGGSNFTRNGELGTDSSDNELKVRLDGVTETVVTEDQVQVLTNKTIDADLNPISELEVDNLKAGVLNTSITLSGASDSDIPSALAVKTYIDNKDDAQNEASEISFDPTSSGLSATNVQDAIDEVEARVDTAESDIIDNATAISDHIADTVDAHDASAISVIAQNGVSSTDVQSALEELQSEITSVTNASIAAPASSTDDAVVRFDGASGKLVQNSSVTISDSGVVSGASIDADINTITNIENADIKSGAAIDASKIADGSVSNAEFQTLDGVTSSIQTQLNDKASSSSLTTHVNDIANPHAVTKAQLNLGNVDNTSDATKNSDIATLTNKTIIGASIEAPTRLDVKQDTLANLIAYATTATDGQLCYATDTKEYYGIVDNVIAVIGGAGDSSNMFVNPDFEGLDSSGLAIGWNLTAGTPSITSVSSEISKGTKAQKITLSSQVLSFYQSVLTPTGIQKQGSVSILYKVPATITDFQICSLVDGIEQNCVPTNKLILDNTYHNIEIPLIFGSTSAGIKAKTTATATGDLFFDASVLAQGLGTQNLMLDNVYSAKISSTGVISGENVTGWLSSCTNAATPICTFKTGLFTSKPNCWHKSNGFIPESSVATETTFQGSVINTAGAIQTISREYFCQKSGNDYLASSANVYSSTNGNYSRRPYTPSSTQGFGTSPTIACYESKEGEYANIDCQITVGTSPAALEARVALPLGLTSSSLGGSRVAGKANESLVSTTRFGGMTVIIEPSVSYMTFGLESSSVNGTTKQNGNSLFAGGEIFHFYARIPIAGWSNSNQIVGSFAGVPAVPGYQGLVDTFSVSYGTTSVNNDCTSSPCSYFDQIGTGAVSVTRSSAGTYLLNLSKTYSKVKCVTSYSISTSNGAGGMQSNSSCLNCASVPFTSGQANTGAKDSSGTIMCQGQY